MTLRWHALGIGPEDVTIACGVSLDNMAGGCTGTLPHPTARAKNGKSDQYPNGEPDAAKEGDFIRWRSRGDPPLDVLAALRAAKPDLLRVLAARKAAKAALDAEPPLDCPEQRRAAARRGLEHFVRDGWTDQAALIGWTAGELYQVPPFWSRVDLTGAVLMIGDRQVVAITEASIAIETLFGSRLKFRWIGREHLA